MMYLQSNIKAKINTLENGNRISKVVYFMDKEEVKFSNQLARRMHQRLNRKFTPFQRIECTLHSAEYIQIRSWLTKHEPQNIAIQEINQAVEHSFSPRPYLHQFSNEANETFARVFLILQRELNKKK